MHRSIVLSLVTLVLTACGGEREEYVIGPGKFGCFSPFPAWCMVNEPESPRGAIHGGIEGFEFAWCERAEITVEHRPVFNPPADGSSRTTHLVELHSQERVDDDTEMELAVLPELYDADNDTLPGEFDLSCEDAQVCDDFEAAMLADESQGVIATFACTDAEEDPILRSFTLRE